jgi:putative membrane protein
MRRITREASMRSIHLFAGAAVAVLALSACNKGGGGAPPEAANAANNAVSSSAQPVAGAENAAAAAVGQASAAATTTAGGFVTAAATSDMYEVAAGKLAQQKATSPAVKQFAARMVHDHTASTDKLKKLLAGGGISATPPADMDERRKGMLNNLNGATGADFDKMYVDQQVAAHEEAQTLFQGYIDKGDNAALKGFASSVLPTIKAHLAMAKKLQAAGK